MTMITHLDETINAYNVEEPIDDNQSINSQDSDHEPG